MKFCLVGSSGPLEDLTSHPPENLYRSDNEKTEKKIGEVGKSSYLRTERAHLAHEEIDECVFLCDSIGCNRLVRVCSRIRVDQLKVQRAKFIDSGTGYRY